MVLGVLVCVYGKGVEFTMLGCVWGNQKKENIIVVVFIFVQFMCNTNKNKMLASLRMIYFCKLCGF